MTTARSQRDTTPALGTRLRVFREQDFEDEGPTQPGAAALAAQALALGTQEGPRVLAEGTRPVVPVVVRPAPVPAADIDADAWSGDEPTDLVPPSRVRPARVTEPLPLPRPPRP